MRRWWEGCVLVMAWEMFSLDVAGGSRLKGGGLVRRKWGGWEGGGLVCV